MSSKEIRTGSKLIPHVFLPNVLIFRRRRPVIVFICEALVKVMNVDSAGELPFMQVIQSH